MTNKIVFSEILQMCLKIPKLVRQKDHKKKKMQNQPRSKLCYHQHQQIIVDQIITIKISYFKVEK